MSGKYYIIKYIMKLYKIIYMFWYKYLCHDSLMWFVIYIFIVLTVGKFKKKYIIKEKVIN